MGTSRFDELQTGDISVHKHLVNVHNYVTKIVCGLLCDFLFSNFLIVGWDLGFVSRVRGSPLHLYVDRQRLENGSLFVVVESGPRLHIVGTWVSGFASSWQSFPPILFVVFWVSLLKFSNFMSFCFYSIRRRTVFDTFGLVIPCCRNFKIFFFD